MKARVKTKEIRMALGKLHGLPGSDNGLSPNAMVILEADEFEGLRLVRNTAIASAIIACSAEVIAPGKLVVLFSALQNSMTACEDEEADLSAEGNQLVITSGQGEAGLEIFREQEASPSPKRLAGREVRVTRLELLRNLKTALMAAAKDRSKPNQTGVCFRKMNGSLAIFGLNGHRLHVSRLDTIIDRLDPEENSERDMGILLPVEGAQSVLKVLGDEKSDCVIEMSPEGMQFDTMEITLRLAVSSYNSPFVEDILKPETKAEISFDRQTLLNAAKAVAPMSTDGGVALEWTKETLKVSASATGAKVARSLPCKASEPLSIYIESRYLMDFLECCEWDEIKLKIGSKQDRIFYREGEFDFLILLRKPGVTPIKKK